MFKGKVYSRRIKKTHPTVVISFAYLAGAFLLLVLAHQIPARYTLDPTSQAAEPYLYNFYAHEKGGDGTEWRWSKPEAYLRLLPLDSNMRVQLEVENFAVSENAHRPLQLGLVGDPHPPGFDLAYGRANFTYVTNKITAFLPHTFFMNDAGRLAWVWFEPTIIFVTWGLPATACDRRAGRGNVTPYPAARRG